MAYASKAGRARTSASAPTAHAICDRCGFRYNHSALQFQYDWAGPSIINKRILVCGPCYDTPQEQLRSIVLPADPMPILNPRSELYVTDESDYRYTYAAPTINAKTGIPVPSGQPRITQNSDNRVVQQTGEPPGGLNATPGIDPNVPGANDPGLPYENTTVPNTGAYDE